MLKLKKEVSQFYGSYDEIRESLDSKIIFKKRNILIVKNKKLKKPELKEINSYDSASWIAYKVGNFDVDAIRTKDEESNKILW